MLQWPTGEPLDLAFLHSVVGLLVGSFAFTVTVFSAYYSFRLADQSRDQRARTSRRVVVVLCVGVSLVLNLPLALGSDVDSWGAPMFYQNYAYLSSFGATVLILFSGFVMARWVEKDREIVAAASKENQEQGSQTQYSAFLIAWLTIDCAMLVVHCLAIHGVAKRAGPAWRRWQWTLLGLSAMHWLSIPVRDVVTVDLFGLDRRFFILVSVFIRWMVAAGIVAFVYRSQLLERKELG